MRQYAPRVFVRFILPDDIKNGIRNRPESTRSRSDCSVDPSKGNAPQTSTYSTTPNDCRRNNSRDLVNHEHYGAAFFIIIIIIIKLTQTSISGPT